MKRTETQERDVLIMLRHSQHMTATVIAARLGISPKIARAVIYKHTQKEKADAKSQRKSELSQARYRSNKSGK